MHGKVRPWTGDFMFSLSLPRSFSRLFIFWVSLSRCLSQYYLWNFQLSFLSLFIFRNPIVEKLETRDGCSRKDRNNFHNFFLSHFANENIKTCEDEKFQVSDLIKAGEKCWLTLTSSKSGETETDRVKSDLNFTKFQKTFRVSVLKFTSRFARTSLGVSKYLEKK